MVNPPLNVRLWPPVGYLATGVLLLCSSVPTIEFGSKLALCTPSCNLAYSTILLVQLLGGAGLVLVYAILKVHFLLRPRLLITRQDQLPHKTVSPSRWRILAFYAIIITLLILTIWSYFLI